MNPEVITNYKDLKPWVTMATEPLNQANRAKLDLALISRLLRHAVGYVGPILSPDPEGDIFLNLCFVNRGNLVEVN